MNLNPNPNPQPQPQSSQAPYTKYKYSGPARPLFLPTYLIKDLAQVGDDIPRVVVRDEGRPACADAVAAVDEDHGDNRDIVVWLDRLAIVIEELRDG